MRDRSQPGSEGEGASSSALAAVTLLRDEVADWEEYPFSVPAISNLQELCISRSVCFFAGENGLGKSTLLEAIADNFGFGSQGGSKNMMYVGAPDEQIRELSRVLRLRWKRKPLRGYFLRTESFFNIATYIDELDLHDAYGGTSLHEQSHGEAFLALFQHRFGGDGFYVLDEPETALSPQRQLAFLVLLHRLVSSDRGVQFLIATHSPIIVAYPDAQILSFVDGRIEEVGYKETEAYQVASGFLRNPELYLKHLLG